MTITQKGLLNPEGDHPNGEPASEHHLHEREGRLQMGGNKLTIKLDLEWFREADGVINEWSLLRYMEKALRDGLAADRDGSPAHGDVSHPQGGPEKVSPVATWDLTRTP